MSYFVDLIQDYAEQHRKPFTKLTHYLGVPTLILAIEIALTALTPALAWGVIISLSFFYLYLSLSAGLLITLCLIAMGLLAKLILSNPLGLFLGGVLFLVGVLAQWLGHCHEKNKPAFFNNILHMLVAPLFLVQHLHIFKKKPKF